MTLRFSRRSMIRGVGGAALAQSLAISEAAPGPRQWPIEEGADTPKLCLAPGDGGGPLPANMQPPASGATGTGAAGGRGGRGGGGGYGGYLAPRKEMASTPPVDAAGRGGFGGNPAAA